MLSILANFTFAQSKFTRHFYFESDSFNVTQSHNSGLNYIISELHKNPYYRIQIDGNTDSIGDRNYNVELSKKRIKSISEELISHGIRRDRIKVSAKGEEWPKFNNGTDAGKSLNRRVDVLVLMDRDSCFKDGCAQTCIPKGTFDPYFTNEIEIKFIPITNVQQMQENNISAQTTSGGYLISSGMLRVTSTYRGSPVYPKKNVTIRVPAYKLDQTFQLYEGSGSQSVQWTQKKIEMKRGSGDCQYFEIDGSYLNKWVNLDKPRPKGNMICVNNPFAYRDMPSIDSDSSVVIQNDIVLSFSEGTFGTINPSNLDVQSTRVTTLCDMIQNRMTSATTDNKIVKDKDILILNSFKLRDSLIHPKNPGFTAYFPATEDLKDKEFFTGVRGQNNEIIWASAGKADSVYNIEGCSCKYVVKSFNQNAEFLNVGVSSEKSSDLINRQKLLIRDDNVNEIFVYDKFHKSLSVVKIDSNGRFVIPVIDDLSKIIIVATYKSGKDQFLFDSKLSTCHRRWFHNERIVKSKHFRKVEGKKGFRLKSVSCRSKI